MLIPPAHLRLGAGDATENKAALGRYGRGVAPTQTQMLGAMIGPVSLSAPHRQGPGSDSGGLGREEKDFLIERKGLGNSHVLRGSRA